MGAASRKTGCPDSVHKVDQQGRRCGTGCVRMTHAGQPQDNNERLNRPNVRRAVAVPEKKIHVRGYDHGCRANDFGEAVAGLDACVGDYEIPSEETKSFRLAWAGLLVAVVLAAAVERKKRESWEGDPI